MCSLPVQWKPSLETGGVRISNALHSWHDQQSYREKTRQYEDRRRRNRLGVHHLAYRRRESRGQKCRRRERSRGSTPFQRRMQVKSATGHTLSSASGRCDSISPSGHLRERASSLCQAERSDRSRVTAEKRAQEYSFPLRHEPCARVQTAMHVALLAMDWYEAADLARSPLYACKKNTVVKPPERRATIEIHLPGHLPPQAGAIAAPDSAHPGQERAQPAP